MRLLFLKFYWSKTFMLFSFKSFYITRLYCYRKYYTKVLRDDKSIKKSIYFYLIFLHISTKLEIIIIKHTCWNLPIGNANFVFSGIAFLIYSANKLRFFEEEGVVRFRMRKEELFFSQLIKYNSTSRPPKKSLEGRHVRH